MKTTNNEQSPSLDPLGRPTEGQTLTRPTAAGWWWWWARSMRTGKDEWTIVQVDSYEWGGSTHLYCHSQGMSDDGDGGRARVWGGLWAGPLTPPVGPTEKLRRAGAEDGSGTEQ